MIATLEGSVSEKLLDLVVLSIGGVGYGLFVTSEDYEQLLPAQKTKLYVYEHIRENSHDLFGFVKIENKGLFEQLLSVSGIGPKMALSILNTGSADAVRQAIAEGDVKYLQAASGVGRRVAERVVVELKDKVGLFSADGTVESLLNARGNSKDEAIQGLVALGYSAQDAVKALRGIDGKLSAEERIKQALKSGLGQ